MPNRPTKEYWQKVVPALKKEGYSSEFAAKIAASNWYNRLTPSVKEAYEKIRFRREHK